MSNKYRDAYKFRVRQHTKAIRRARTDRVYDALGQLCHEGVFSPEDVFYLLPKVHHHTTYTKSR